MTPTPPGLLTRLPGPRYTFHDLLRAYAAELVGEYEDDDEWRTAMLRAHDHHLDTAHQAALRSASGRARAPLVLGDPQPGTLPEDVPDDERAHAWFEAEHAVLVGLIEQAGQAGLDTHAWQLPWCVAEHLVQLGDRVARAHAHGSLGRALVQLGARVLSRKH